MSTFWWADLSESDLTLANLWGASFGGAELVNAALVRANLGGADFQDADLSNANLSGANLVSASLVETTIAGAAFNNCSIYGISAWNLKGDPVGQNSLNICPPSEPPILIDNLKVAQFVYLLSYNPELKDIIDTITSKVVLILGRFTKKRKPVLDAVRNKLREQDYIPVIFDFTKPMSHNYIQPVSTLAHLARFIIADLTNPKIVLEEISYIMNKATIPLIPILLRGKKEPVTLYNLRTEERPVLDTYYYLDIDDLLGHLQECVIAPAEAKANVLLEKKVKLLQKRHQKMRTG